MKAAMLTAAALLALAGTDAAASWVACAKEGAYCSFEGRREVAYGAGNKWVRKAFSNGVKCTTDKFGSDPAPGVVKSCSVASVTTADASPVNSSWARCAGEGQACRFSGSRRVAYGAQGKYNYRQASGSAMCNNQTFGDPIPGVAKSCYAQP